MKKLAYLLVAPIFLFSCGGGESTENTTDIDSTATDSVETVDEVVEDDIPKPLKSPRMQATGVVNGVQITVDFGSPYVKERVIWGDLVPYDKIWRAGANEATAITFDADVLVEGNEVAAGTYALFVIPKENDKWTIILNEEWSKEIHGVWGAYDHKPEKDVVRFEIMPVFFPEDNVESLTFSMNDEAVQFQWEKAMFAFTVSPK